MILRNVKAFAAGREGLPGCDIAIENGVITEVGRLPRTPGETSVDAKGCVASPAFIDMHCHLRDPGFEYKEDIISGTRAAAAGGYGTVVCMPNTLPVADNPDTLAYIIDKAKRQGSCRVLPCAAVTRGQKGAELVDFDALAAAGAVAFSDDGKPVSDTAVMYEAMKKCADRGYLIITHPEELSLVGVTVNEGEISRRLGVHGTPNIAEDVMIARDIALAEATGCRLHVAHISTRGGMQLVREAKARGVNVTCETCPHYFAFTDEDVLFYGSNAKMSPPLRSRVDLGAVIAAIADGTVDCISTDHAPHTEKEKNPDRVAAGSPDASFAKAPNGVIGLQTALAAGISCLVNTGKIPLTRLLELLTLNPARILGLSAALTPGNSADITVFDPTEPFVVTRSLLRSKSTNTPFLGASLQGVVRHVFSQGRKTI